MAKPIVAAKSKVSGARQSRSAWINAVGAFARRPLVLLAVFVLFFSSIGAYTVLRSEALVSYLSPKQCYLRGRVYTGNTTGNPCANKCLPSVNGLPSAGTLVYAYPYNYCSAAVTKASSTMTWSKCDQQLRRVWITNLGCARYWPGVDKYDAPQCKGQYVMYRMYYASPTASGYDKCDLG